VVTVGLRDVTAAAQACHWLGERPGPRPGRAGLPLPVRLWQARRCTPPTRSRVSQAAGRSEPTAGLVTVTQAAPGLGPGLQYHCDGCGSAAATAAAAAPCSRQQLVELAP
jgi:hypothetical protein